MFQVGRYDPKEETRKNEEQEKSDRKRRKKSRQKSPRKRARDDPDAAEDDEAQKKAHSSLHVIAPEVDGSGSKGIHAKLPPKTAEEAFDDLDIVDELIDGEADAHPGEDEDGRHVSQVTEAEIREALHMSSLPIDKAAEGWKLAPFLVENLRRDGFEHFFPIQALSIPDVIASERHAHIQAQDICITAPTGAGKTLAYCIPILNSLANRQIRRLRALVVLPSRDLATQVYRVFESYVEGSDLRVGLAIGQSDFRAEQISLTVDSKSHSPEMARHRLSFDPGNIDLALKAYRYMGFSQKNESSKGGHLSAFNNAQSFGENCIDVLVCTPGRLVDHLDNTPGFTLQHLRFLVVDEADRLLSQSYHNWIGRVIDAANSASVAAWREIISNDNKLEPLKVAEDQCSYVLEPITWRRGGTEGDDSEFNTNDSYFARAASVCRPVQLRKFLVSATLTRDPQKLATLRLVNPKHFDVHQLNTKGEKGGSKKYSMPRELDEYTVECTAEQKPIVALALILERLQQQQDTATSRSIVAVFTASLDSTHRLARLLQLLWVSAGYGDPKSVVEFSSALTQKERSALMKRCNDPKDNVSVVVCSDGMSRGMDIEFVSCVINYDVPSFAKTYVHRCGRTARAGKKGVAISLLKGGQVSQFHKMRQIIYRPEDIRTMGVKKNLVRDAIPMYRNCVKALRDILDAEENGELSHTEVLSNEYIPEI